MCLAYYVDDDDGD